MASNSVVSDSTDPATMRPDLPAATATGTQFIPMILPDFCPKISLPSHVKPDNAWALFELFLPRDQLAVIVRHTNDHVDHLDQYELDENTSKTRLYQWTPLTIKEAYVYFGIRIYMGIHIENRIRFY